MFSRNVYNSFATINADFITNQRKDNNNNINKSQKKELHEHTFLFDVQLTTADSSAARKRETAIERECLKVRVQERGSMKVYEIM